MVKEIYRVAIFIEPTDPQMDMLFEQEYEIEGFEISKGALDFSTCIELVEHFDDADDALEADAIISYWLNNRGIEINRNIDK